MVALANDNKYEVRLGFVNSVWHLIFLLFG